MTQAAEDTLIPVLLKHLPQAFCRSMEDGLMTAGMRAYEDSAKRHEGHLPSVLGQARHFHSNEQFALALDIAQIPHSPLRANNIIIGEQGPLLLGRFSTNRHNWNNARRSQRRLEIASHNQWLERVIQPGLFSEQTAGTQIAVFFISVYSGSVRIQPEQPLSIDLAVVDTSLSEPLFIEPLSVFLNRYAQPVEQADTAQVRLKVPAKKRQDQPA